MKQSLFQVWGKSIFWPAVVLVGTLGSSSNIAAQTTAAQHRENAQTSGVVRVVGNHLTRDETIWTPHGLNFVAFVQPPAAQPGGCNGKTSNVFQVAWNRYQLEGAKLFTELSLWGADTIRIQVSQQGLDPKTRLYSKVFFDRFVEAVYAARSVGLNVVISIQDECQSGDPTTADYPGPENERVWGELAPLFETDLGIMFEIYNEPEPNPSPAAWRKWQNRFDRVISRIRSSGASNVVIADGLAFATTLDGAPYLTDSSGQVAYAVHPYFHRPNLTPQIWDRKFGRFAATAPVIVTEWTTVANASRSGSTYYCDSNTPLQAVSLMQYLQSHGIGMLGFAWDFTGGVFGSAVYYADKNTSTFDISTFTGTGCGEFGFGPGDTMQSWFQTGTVPGSPR